MLNITVNAENEQHPKFLIIQLIYLKIKYKADIKDF